MKKRQVMSLVLAGIMAASLTACGGGAAANNKETKAESGQTESGKTESAKTEASSKSEDRSTCHCQRKCYQISCSKNPDTVFLHTSCNTPYTPVLVSRS